MKNTSLTTKLITAFMFLAVLVYFGIQAWRYFTDPIITASVYTYRSEHAISLSGMLVRDEEVVDCTEQLVELTRAEGERVAAGKRIATVYQSAEALSAEQETTTLRQQLEQLRYAQTAARDTETALRLDSDIEERIVAVRAAIVGGNYTSLDSGVPTLKSTVLRREYAYRGSADLSDRIAATEEKLQEASRSAGGSRAIVAPFAGVYSSVTDGYESVLTPDMLPTLSPSELESISPVSVSTTVGKLVRGETWYYAAAVDEDEAAEIVKGEHYELAITGVDTMLPVVVDSISRGADGRCLVVFSGREYLSSVTALRSQSAELILKSYTGLRIPKNALRISEDGQSGVYCRIGRQAWFKPIEVIYQGEDYCLVRPDLSSIARESELVFYTLRTGDEAIITADRLYNGKVVD